MTEIPGTKIFLYIPVCAFYCRLWTAVSAAIVQGDQNAATHEKYLLEEAQRQGAKERKAKMVDWVPRLFERDAITGDWMYKYAE